jgi:hypothetical protein
MRNVSIVYQRQPAIHVARSSAPVSVKRRNASVIDTTVLQQRGRSIEDTELRH